MHDYDDLHLIPLAPSHLNSDPLPLLLHCWLKLLWFSLSLPWVVLCNHCLVGLHVLQFVEDGDIYHNSIQVDEFQELGQDILSHLQLWKTRGKLENINLAR